MKKLIYILILVLAFSCASTQAQNYKTHKVRSGETVETIAKQYNVTPTAIYGLNPDSRKELKTNSVLIIPKAEVVIQEPKKTVSKELKGFKNHKVKRKETLYSLAKQYNVTQDEIKKHNTFLYANNLRKGDKLEIPIYKTTTTVEPVKSATQNYIVKPKEGKWRVAYQFGITVQELEDLNPEMGEVLQPGQSIIVPNLESKEVKTVDDRYSYYTVLPKEGFYRLKLKLNLEKEELEKLNPGLEETGLKSGMVLKVPFDSSIAAQNSGIEGNLLEGEQLITSDLITQVKLNDGSQKHIAIMLPFKLNKIDTDSVSDVKELIKKDRTLSISLDFHSGVLMALDSLKKLGLNLKVDVYDTKNMQSQVSSILRQNNFDETDVVIGPLMPKLFNNVASELKGKNIALVSPIAKTVDLNENVFQSRPSDEALVKKIVSHYKADSTAQIVVVSDLNNKATSTMLKREFSRASLVSSRTNKKTGKDAYYIFDQDLKNALKPGNNIVFLETDNAGLVSNVTSILNSLATNDIKITLATTNENRAFEGEEVSNYHLSNLHFTYPSISKTVNEEDNNSFVKKYKREYGVTPNAYAVRGFDLTMDVVLRLVSSNDLYQSVNDSPLTIYVENKFGYKKKLFGGYYNDTVYLVRYNDLKIDEIKD